MWKKMLNYAYNLFSNEESGIKVVGNNWFARYSNAFKDREDEYFPVKAIDQYIERVDVGIVPTPELWVWHMPIVIGKAKAVARIEKFVVAAGIFPETSLGQAAKAYLSNHKAKLSHGFVFDKDTYKDGAYWDYNTFEISILPFERGVEANAYTNFEVKDMTISKEKQEFFAEMFGAETAKELIANTSKSSKILEEVGVQFKSFVNIGNLKHKTKAEGDEEEDDEEETPEGEGQAAEGEAVPDEEDDEEEKKKKALVAANWKALVADVVNDMSEVIEGQLKLGKEVNGLRAALEQAKKDNAARQKAQDDKIAALQAENKQLRDELALTPRGTQASQSDSTVIDTTTADGKDLKEKLAAKENGKSDDFWNFAKDKSQK